MATFKRFGNATSEKQLLRAKLENAFENLGSTLADKINEKYADYFIPYNYDNVGAGQRFLRVCGAYISKYSKLEQAQAWYMQHNVGNIDKLTDTDGGADTITTHNVAHGSGNVTTNRDTEFDAINAASARTDNANKNVETATNDQTTDNTHTNTYGKTHTHDFADGRNWADALRSDIAVASPAQQFVDGFGMLLIYDDGGDE